MICATAPRLEVADLQKLDCETFAQRYLSPCDARGGLDLTWIWSLWAHSCFALGPGTSMRPEISTSEVLQKKWSHLSRSPYSHLPHVLLCCRFKVTSKLGQGGFCDVLCVKDASGRLSALKVLKSSTNICTSPAACAEAGRCSHAPAVSPEVCLFREARVLKHAKHP